MESKGEGGRFGDLPIRLVSGAVYVVVAVVCLFTSPASAAVFLAVVAGLCVFEFYRMMRTSGHAPIAVVGVPASAAFPLAALLWGLDGLVWVALVLMAVLLVWYVASHPTAIEDIALTAFGSLYAGLLLSCYVLVRAGIPGFAGGAVAVVVYASIVCNDSFAYLVGSRFGKHRMAPRISPHKTWEGFLGGVVASMAVWLLVLLVPGVAASVSEALLVGAACGVAGFFGDLAESRIKRGVGVKDAGRIMPGHGGMLDRVDSMIMVSFVSYLILVAVGVL